MSRRDELAGNLQLVEAQVLHACAASGRDRAEVTVIAVSKTWPESDIRLLFDLGVRDFGENREQEASDKALALADLPIRWHFIGQLQSNKAARVARFADVVHSIDRERIAQALSAGAVAAGRVVTCLVQVSLESNVPQNRGGVVPEEVLPLARRVAQSEGLELGGVMAVAPLLGHARDAFSTLSEVSKALTSEFSAANMVSAGMSGDLYEAVAAGATHLRIGSALLGNR